MCESTVFLKEGGAEKVLMKEVASRAPEGRQAPPHEHPRRASSRSRRWSRSSTSWATASSWSARPAAPAGADRGLASTVTGPMASTSERQLGRRVRQIGVGLRPRCGRRRGSRGRTAGLRGTPARAATRAPAPPPPRERTRLAITESDLTPRSAASARILRAASWLRCPPSTTSDHAVHRGRRPPAEVLDSGLHVHHHRLFGLEQQVRDEGLEHHGLRADAAAPALVDRAHHEQPDVAARGSEPLGQVVHPRVEAEERAPPRLRARCAPGRAP